MNDIQIIARFLNYYSLEVIIIGLIVCLLTGVFKKFIPYNVKSLIGLLPFILGIVIYGFYAFYLMAEHDFSLMLGKGVQAGAVATLFYAFYKQLAVNGKSVKQVVENVLKGILTGTVTTDVSKLISKSFSKTDSDDETERKVEEVLRQNTDMPEDVLKAITKLITTSLSTKK